MTKIGVVLLDQKNRYLVGEKLPKRPDFDKLFLSNMCRDKKLLCSTNTLIDLPMSITNHCASVTNIGTDDWEVNLGIKTFKEFPPDIFFISRTPKYEPIELGLADDKFFDINWLKANYNMIINHYNLEIWLIK
jgi:hypothetical protein